MPYLCEGDIVPLKVSGGSAQVKCLCTSFLMVCHLGTEALTRKEGSDNFVHGQICSRLPRSSGTRVVVVPLFVTAFDGTLGKVGILTVEKDTTRRGSRLVASKTYHRSVTLSMAERKGMVYIHIRRSSTPNVRNASKAAHGRLRCNIKTGTIADFHSLLGHFLALGWADQEPTHQMSDCHMFRDGCISYLPRPPMGNVSSHLEKWVFIPGRRISTMSYLLVLSFLVF